MFTLSNITIALMRSSGGQRKRLAIALEMVSNPPVMFLDEPTSGLDSSSCAQLLALLKQLASEGRTIVCTIHQPSAKLFEMFDALFMMADGQNTYQGSIEGLVPFLATFGLECPSYHNPADYVMEVASGEYGDYIDQMATAVRDRAKADVPYEEMKVVCRTNRRGNDDGGNDDALLENGAGDGESSEDATSGSGYPTSGWTQFRVLYVRTFKSIIRDRTLTRMRLASHVFIGVVLGLLYFGNGNEASKVHNNSGMLFFCMLFSMFTAMMPTVLTFPLEMGTFKREHLNHWYSVKTYYMAKVMADMPFQILYPIVFTLIVYFMSGQPYEAERLAMFTLMCMQTSLVAQSLGIVIGAAADLQTAVFLAPISTIPILLFSGAKNTNINTICVVNCVFYLKASLCPWRTFPPRSSSSPTLPTSGTGSRVPCSPSTASTATSSTARSPTATSSTRKSFSRNCTWSTASTGSTSSASLSSSLPSEPSDTSC